MPPFVRTSMFQFHPALQPKKSSRASTPRTLVVPAPEETPSPPGEERSGDGPDPPALSSSARKYHVAENASEAIGQYGLATGLPSPRESGAASARSSVHSLKNSGSKNDPTRLQARGAATNTAAAPRRTLRGSLHYLKRESVLLTKRIVRSSRHLYRQLSMQQLLAYLLVLGGMVSESFTPAPRHNVPMGIVLFMASSRHNSGVFELEHRVVVAGLCGTTLVDFVWLLRPQEGAFNGFLRVELENATHLSLALCAAIKLWLLFSLYFDLGGELNETTSPPSPRSPEEAATRGMPWQQRVWSRLRFVFPRKTLPRRSHLSYEVLMRVLGLVWLHGVCGTTLLVLGLVATVANAAVFRAAPLGLPLPLAMLFKAASTLLSYVLATQHMNYHACLAVSGCHRLAHHVDACATDVVLKFTPNWMRRVRHAKVLDAVLGVYLMGVYYAAIHATTFIAGDTVLAVLVITAAVVVVVDMWAPLLILVVARCGAVLHRHHRDGTVEVDPYYPNQLAWGDDDDDNEAGRESPGKTNASSSSSSSSASSSGESSSEDHDNSSSGSSTDARRRRRSRERLRSQSSRRRSLARTTPPPLLPQLPRVRSMLIINDEDLADRDDLVGGSTPFWVRYWDAASGRSYLVHGLTKETVWEIGGPPPSARPRSSQQKTPRGGDGRVSAVVSSRGVLPTGSSSSFPPPTSARHSPGSARVSSHPTSESDVIVTTTTASPVAPLRSPRNSGASTSRRASTSPLLRAEDFSLLWDALPDGGNFTCRVSKIPSVDQLRRHLHTHGFTVAMDGLNLAGHRTIHFYAVVTMPTADGEHGEYAVRRASASVAFFLGEFVFDSLSLKLWATFRCPDVDAIVPFVKKLQLKEIVGAYAPCD